MKPYLFYSIILPLLTVEGTSWINISTASVTLNNHFTNLLHNDYVRSLEITLCCQACLELGETGTLALLLR